MNRIIQKEQFSEKVVKLVVEAPEVAKARKPGHFVIVRCGSGGERIPLTIADADVAVGTVTLVVQNVGVSTAKICALEVGDSLTDLVGPLGRATDIGRRDGTVVCCGGGVGVAPLLPIIRAFKEAGNRVVSVLAARSKELIILEKEVRETLLARCLSLKPPYDEIAKAYYYDELDAGEIAGQRGVKKKTIQTQIYRARSMLRRMYEKEKGA